jgi:hypothetical protein
VVDDQSSGDTFAPGSRVAVPWGLDVLQGTVVDTHGQGPTRRVVVSVDVPDTGEEPGTHLVTYRARDLVAAASVANERQPGAWLHAYQYEEQLGRFLEHILRTEASYWSLDRERDAAEPESFADFTLHTGNRRVIIEAKALPPDRSISQNVIDQLLRHLLSSHASAALLVTSNRLSSDASERLQDALRDGLIIRVVQWRSSEDNTDLDQAISDLLSAA